MMEACSFDESNTVLGRPVGTTAEQCDPLSVWRGVCADGAPRVISCFKLTKDELEEINRTGRVWLFVMGHTMPPVALQTAHPWKS
jgi:hypothetical protein